MFRPHGYFRGIPCPNSSKCELPNCFFNHELSAAVPSSSTNSSSTGTSTSNITPKPTPTNKIITENDKGVEEQPPKRRKLDVEQFQKVSLEDIDNEARRFKEKESRNNVGGGSSGGSGGGGDEWTVVGKGGKHSKTRKETGGPVHNNKLTEVEKKPLRSILKRPVAVTPSHSPSSSDAERGFASPASVKSSQSSARNGAMTGLNKEIEKPKPGEIASSSSTLSRRRKLPLSSGGSCMNKFEALGSEVFTDQGGKGAAQALVKTESLNPRKVAPAPANHIMRQTLLDMLYAQFTRLNPALKDDMEGRRELIKAALDEEEQHAHDNVKTYSMVMKNRVMSLKKMSLEQYQALDESGNITKQVAKKKGPAAGGSSGGGGDGGGDVDEDEVRQGEKIDTGLSVKAEIVALRQYAHKKEELAAYGYFLTPPSDEELEEAHKALVSAAGFEECDRCRSRFRVYPGRNQDDGSLASGGTCTYHWGRSFMQQKTPGIGTETAKIWDCCKQVVGDSAGCTTAPNHVFIVKSRNRLATVWQFIKTPGADNGGEEEEGGNELKQSDNDDMDEKMDTDEGPENEKNNKVEAICLDCEMCYTVNGLELVRVTATGFPKHDDVLDVLVRPFGEILDLNTRFSGVSPAQFTSAKAYTSTTSTSSSVLNGTSIINIDDESDTENNKSPIPLQIVSSPSEARSILLSLISPSTVIVGHALDNDLNALRLIHPTVVDTAILYPHRRGLPSRNSLKFLARSHLKRHIQQQLPGSEGHDSREDADVAGDLVRWKILQDVKTKKIDKDGKWKKKKG